MRSILASAFLMLLPCLLVAQTKPPEKLRPTTFFPPEHTLLAEMDLAALFESELWERLERNVLLRTFVGYLRKEVGIRVTELTRFRLAGVVKKLSDDSPASNYRGFRNERVIVLESSKPLSFPEPRADEHDYNRRTERTIAGRKAVQEGELTESSWSEPGLWVSIHQKCLLNGSLGWTESVLKGDKRGGVPHRDLMALTAGKRPLAQVASLLEYDKRLLRHMLPFPFAWFTEEDAPKGVVLRLEQDATTEHFSVSMRLRFTTGTAGPVRFQKMLRAQLDKAGNDVRLRALRPALKKLSFVTKGADLLVVLNAGTARQAAKLVVGNQMPAFMMLFFTAARDEAVAEVEVQLKEAESEDVAPEPAPATKEDAPQKQPTKKK